MANDEKYEELSRQVETLRADLEKLTESIGDIARGEIELRRDQVRDAADEAVRRGRRMQNRARAEADRGLHEAADYVRERPLGAVMTAAAIGMVFGFLTAKK
jgi:ElaB/YqjD/DUF883 family membrane-anchored ribosome-binding protein